MKGGGQIPWNAIAFCEVSKTSWQMGKRHTKGDLENHSKANNIFWSSGWTLSVFTKRSGDNSSILQEGITRNLSGLQVDRGWNLERRDLDCILGRFGKVGCIRYLSSNKHNELRVQLNVLVEETFTIPLKCIDVARSTHTDLDVLQEKKIGDYWNVDRASICQILGEDLQTFTLLKKKLPRGYVWSGRDWQKFRRLPDQIFIWPEEWTKIGKAIHNREKQDWAKEKQTLDNARKLRGLYFIDPDGREYSEILKKHKKNIRKTHGTSHAMQRMVHLRITKVMQSNDKAKDFKTMYGCTVEFSSIHKATSGMLSTHKTWRSHCRKWIFLWHITIWCASLSPMAQAMKIPDAKAAVEKKWKKIQTIPAWQLDKVKCKK